MDGFDEITNFLDSIVHTSDYEAEKQSINKLNDDFLRLIFSFLGSETLQSMNIQLVCKRWFVLSNRMIYCRPKLSLFCGDMKESEDGCAVPIRRKIFSLAQALYFSDGVIKDLVLSATHDSRYPFSKSLFEVITKLCPTLVDLTLNKFVDLMKVGPEDLSFSFPKNLQKLSITRIWFKDQFLDYILKQNSKTLQKLILVRSVLIKGRSIIYNLADCQLKVINLALCCRIHPTVIPFIFENYHESLEELHIISSHMKQTIPPGLVMKKLRSVTLYESYQYGCVIPTHDDDVMWAYFRAMENVEELSILTFNSPFVGNIVPSKFFDYLSKIKTLKKLKELTLPVEPMRHGMFGDSLIFKELRLAGVKIRIDTLEHR